MPIAKVAVIGSGVMGSGIAAHIANSGTPVLLLDIVLKDNANRNALTEGALEKQLQAKPSGFTHKRKVKLVTAGNFEDHLELLRDVDWIIEAVVEKLEIKQDVYRKIDKVRKAGSVVSSNTSTLPLHVLLGGMPESFRQNFMITHFFNPPRFMRLLEMAAGPETRNDAYLEIKKFADVKLGKGVVDCKDTPGFIANRIGVFWMMMGLLEAIRLNITVEEADAIMSRPLGIPKTGVFGLFDLIGIDLMPLIAKAMLATLPAGDAFRALYQEPELVKTMIKDGYTGRKGKGGFTRINKQGEKKFKEVMDLQTGQYRAEQKPQLESLQAAKTGGMKALLAHPDKGGEYARSVMGKTLAYVASLLPEISDDIASIDNAMKWGYNWKKGPFEMLDAMGGEMVQKFFSAAGVAIPPLLAAAKGQPHYRASAEAVEILTLQGNYTALPAVSGAWMLQDKKRGAKPILKNASACLWDIGDGIACFELTSKMNSIDPDILSLIEQSTEKVKKDFQGLVIGNDADNFSVGANLGFVLYAANMAAWPMISDIIKQGQRALMGLKYAPFPVVAATSGMALGGGCEIVLHADAVQAHVESYIGLVEVGVGVIPGWGGCKEMLLRSGVNAAGGAMPAIAKAFETIATAKVAGSAEEAKDAGILNEKSRITMNRARVLPDAKQLCLQLAENYTPPESATMHLPGPTAKVALQLAVEQFVAQGKTTPHDVVVSHALAQVLSGGDTDSQDTLTEQQILDLEHAAFMELVKSRGTLDRIEHMLEHGKPLRN